MNTATAVPGNEAAKPDKGKGKVKRMEHNGGKGVGLLLQGWQATSALLLPVIAVGVMWGTTSTRLAHVENRAAEDRKQFREAIEAIRDVLLEHSERIVKIEAWREGPKNGGR